VAIPEEKESFSWPESSSFLFLYIWLDNSTEYIWLVTIYYYLFSIAHKHADFMKIYFFLGKKEDKTPLSTSEKKKKKK
jgi:hypothetical protein